ncbi:leucyl aminopeptidase [Anaerococcus octavius]|uniref:Probable cytosol aminopeptidase n=1 Tax=Anaerococcus octavius TaxID=54007 RepID=A0A2I1M9E0_9FIRM|nr:leucyl aminopeptidase [Anaerococcus octavius]PKZ16765.1 leucyl aminopeptidase [Anaerococcus octavius]
MKFCQIQIITLFFLGLGDKEKLDRDSFQKAIYKLTKSAIKLDLNELSFQKENIDIENNEFLYQIIEAVSLGSYNFDHYKKEKSGKISYINFPEKLDNKNSNTDVEQLVVLDSQNFVRDLVNLRSNDIYPETLAQKVKERFAKKDVNVRIYNENQIKEMNLTAYLEVAKGSDNPPRFIVMEYLNGEKSQKPLVFVGKGLTYDSGGYSIKSNAGMKTMNADMAGAGTVIGAMDAIASNELSVNVVGVVAACENSISGKAYKPGDIIRARNNMTIEIDNTDAEGRITLADAVNYASTEYNPEMIIDLATLTGAYLVALAESYTGAVTNNQKIFEKVLEAAKEADEKIWQLPNDDTIRKYNESQVADVKNSGGKLGSTITAAQFIENFIEEKPWVHLDIAGTAYLSKPQGLFEKGATGVHVKTLYNLAKKYSK